MCSLVIIIIIINLIIIIMMSLCSRDLLMMSLKTYNTLNNSRLTVVYSTLDGNTSTCYPSVISFFFLCAIKKVKAHKSRG